MRSIKKVRSRINEEHCLGFHLCNPLMQQIMKGSKVICRYIMTLWQLLQP